MTADPAATRARRRLVLAAVVFGLPALAFGLAAIALPPTLAWSLVARGIREGRPSWVVLGGLVGVVWLLLLHSVVRRALRRGPPG